jgi:hypothetical protein
MHRDVGYLGGPRPVEENPADVKSSEAPATGKRRTMTVQIGVILDDKKAHVVYSCCSGQVPLL